jgi:tRNA threonylcarbamoyladenosine modification (KEOPS) complex  Pcc1 subunit
MASYLPAVKFAIKPEHGHSPAYQFSKSRQHLRRQGDLTRFEFRYADAILMESIYKEITRLIQCAQSAGIFQDRLIFGNGIVHGRHTV